VQFDGTLGALKPRPVKDLDAQLNDGSIQAPKWMLKSKATLLGGSQRLAALEQIFEYRLIDCQGRCALA
jgi:hypothetical protein